MSVFTKVEGTTNPAVVAADDEPSPGNDEPHEEPEEVREYHPHHVHPHHHVHQIPPEEAIAHLNHHCVKDPSCSHDHDEVPDYSRREQHNADHFIDQVHNHFTHNRHESFVGHHPGDGTVPPYTAGMYKDVRPDEPEDMFHHMPTHRVKGHVHQQSGKDKGANDLFEDAHALLQLVLGRKKDEDENDK